MRKPNLGSKGILKIILSVITSILLFSCSAQKETVNHEFKIIELKEYYDGKGAIIPYTSSQYFIGSPNIIKATPTFEQIKLGEYILKKNIDNYDNKIFNDGKFYFWQIFKKGEDSLKLFQECINEDRKTIKEYYRYYLMFKNEKNEEMLIICLFNFSTSEARHEFANWQDEYLFGLGDFFERNQKKYTINLTRREIEYYK